MRWAFVAWVGLGTALLVGWGLRAADQPMARASLLKARLDAARRTYEYMARNYRENRPPVGELLYRWSCRWLDAEREASNSAAARIAAYQGHLVRMRDLERMTRERWQNRFIPIEEVTAAEFYRTEAEIWLARAESH